MNSIKNINYNQAVILGDFLYTENKGGQVSLSAVPQAKTGDKPENDVEVLKGLP